MTDTADTRTPNAALAYAVLDHIDAHPETWNQATWDCGTAACFAGWAVRLSGGKVETSTLPVPLVMEGPGEIIGLPIDDAAIHLLGHYGYIDDPYSDLFSPDNSRADLGEIVALIFGPRPDGDQ